MAKHLILGAGNLGKALQNQLGDEARLSIWELGEPFSTRFDTEVIWFCQGAGSVSECKDKPDNAMRVHLESPLYIAKRLKPNQKLVVFSSDYAEQFQLSHYAMSKYFMELALEPFENVHCFRVSSLYGPYRPEKTFPFKILKKLFAGEELKLSINEVMPTPVDWLAEKAIEHVEADRKNAYIVPSQALPAYEWAKWVVGLAREMENDCFKNFPEMKIDPNYYTDKERPLQVIGRSRFGAGAMGQAWDPGYLWGKYGPDTIRSCFAKLFPEN